MIYRTEKGSMYTGDCRDILEKKRAQLEGRVNLIFTSPPFPLNRAKKYGNMTGKEYLDWIASMATFFKPFLTPDGSVVLELGNAWDSGLPTHSTLPMEALLEFKKQGDFHLCQEFIYYNPAKLPSPVEWVNKKRVRVKDSFTRIWWLSSSPNPKANNRNVLEEYSEQMKKLIKSKKYNAGKRPSEYSIGNNSFLKDHYSQANHPFSAYNTLTEIKSNNKNKILDICVLGTKPMALGACLFALNNSSHTKVSYPYPVEYRPQISIEAADIWWYGVNLCQ